VRSSTWVTKTVVGIVLATFFSDVGHEMVTAVLPLYLAGIGLGPAAWGIMEGAADLAFSLSKLAGGAVGHRATHKKPWATAGYVATTIGTGAIALVHTFAAVITIRTFAWFGRGFRSPLRDFLLADEVGATHFGRAYGFERSADMIGAVAGPLVAALLVSSGMDFKTVILWSLIPSAVSVFAIAGMARDRGEPREPSTTVATGGSSSTLPRNYWLFVVGVLIFGLGDFSRTFLIFLAASVLGESNGASGVLSSAVLLYAGHNFVSALAAYPAGKLGDARSKSKVLLGGYALGVVTNATLAFMGGSLPWLIAAITMSGIYIAIEETLEKAVVADLLPRERRSLGLGMLASANALGDLGSSVFVGVMLAAGYTTTAFAVPACVGALGVLWMWTLSRRGILK
jgi:MFS family permease